MPKQSAKGETESSPCVLTIAGSDSSGGAGIQADSRTIHALGGFAATAITAITAQNSRGVSALTAVRAKLIGQQIAAVLTDLPIRAVKTGLLSDIGTVRSVVAELANLPAIPLVLDPVLGSTSGTRFLSESGVRVLKNELFARATLITPNWPEAEELSGLRISNHAEAEKAARKIIEKTKCRAVLIKGGHAPGKICVDLLVISDAPVLRYSHSRIKTPNTHGTGCVLSAAIATKLAQGETLEEAVRTAVEFLQKALASGRAKNWGGRGPALH